MSLRNSYFSLEEAKKTKIHIHTEPFQDGVNIIGQNTGSRYSVKGDLVIKLIETPILRAYSFWFSCVLVFGMEYAYTDGL